MKANKHLRGEELIINKCNLLNLLLLRICIKINQSMVIIIIFI